MGEEQEAWACRSPWITKSRRWLSNWTTEFFLAPVSICLFVVFLIDVSNILFFKTPTINFSTAPNPVEQTRKETEMLVMKWNTCISKLCSGLLFPETFSLLSHTEAYKQIPTTCLLKAFLLLGTSTGVCGGTKMESNVRVMVCRFLLWGKSHSRDDRRLVFYQVMDATLTLDSTSGESRNLVG